MASRPESAGRGRRPVHLEPATRRPALATPTRAGVAMWQAQGASVIVQPWRAPAISGCWRGRRAEDGGRVLVDVADVGGRAGRRAELERPRDDDLERLRRPLEQALGAGHEAPAAEPGGQSRGRRLVGQIATVSGARCSGGRRRRRPRAPGRRRRRRRGGGLATAGERLPPGKRPRTMREHGSRSECACIWLWTRDQITGRFVSPPVKGRPNREFDGSENVSMPEPQGSAARCFSEGADPRARAGALDSSTKRPGHQQGVGRRCRSWSGTATRRSARPPTRRPAVSSAGDEYTKKFGADGITYSLIVNDSEALNKVRSGQQFDMIHPCIENLQDYVNDGLVQPGTRRSCPASPT